MRIFATPITSEPWTSGERGSRAVIQRLPSDLKEALLDVPSTALVCPPPHAEIAAATANERHPPMGGILAGRKGMGAEAASSDGFIST